MSVVLQMLRKSLFCQRERKLRSLLAQCMVGIREEVLQQSGWRCPFSGEKFGGRIFSEKSNTKNLRVSCPFEQVLVNQGNRISEKPVVIHFSVCSVILVNLHFVCCELALIGEWHVKCFHYNWKNTLFAETNTSMQN